MFSVVVPSYRHGRYLPAAVRSALASRWVAEVLIVDDGSDDDSREWIGRWVRAHSGRVRELEGSGVENRGAARRLDELVVAARCEWVAVLNSDDCFAPGRFEVLRARCTEGVDFLCGHLLVVDEEGRHRGTKRGVFEPEYPFPPELDVAALAARGDLLPLLANQNFVATTSNMVFRRSLHAAIGGFRDLRYVHDWDFALRAALQGRCLYLPHYLSVYRLHGSNTIAEDGRAVAGEVQRVFSDLEAEIPSPRRDRHWAAALRGNRYLAAAPPGGGRGAPGEVPACA